MSTTLPRNLAIAFSFMPFHDMNFTLVLRVVQDRSLSDAFPRWTIKQPKLQRDILETAECCYLRVPRRLDAA